VSGSRATLEQLPSPTQPCGLGPPSPALRERVPRAARRVRVWPVAVLLLAAGVATAAEAPPGASSCSGCHPGSATVDTPVPPIRGRDAAEIVTAMQAFRSGERPSTVMGRIARGFSDDEIRAIAVWLTAQH
jgi:cytochrome subunit of sulfide dehydrogenase